MQVSGSPRASTSGSSDLSPLVRERRPSAPGMVILLIYLDPASASLLTIFAFVSLDRLDISLFSS